MRTTWWACLGCSGLFPPVRSLRYRYIPRQSPLPLLLAAIITHTTITAATITCRSISYGACLEIFLSLPHFHPVISVRTRQSHDEGESWFSSTDDFEQGQGNKFEESTLVLGCLRACSVHEWRDIQPSRTLVVTLKVCMGNTKWWVSVSTKWDGKRECTKGAATKKGVISNKRRTCSKNSFTMARVHRLCRGKGLANWPKSATLIATINCNWPSSLKERIPSAPVDTSALSLPTYLRDEQDR